MARPDISFVILTWNSEKYILNCIDSIFNALNKSMLVYEIFIVDNGSKDKTIDILKRLQAKHPETIKLILLNQNTGTTYSRNLALKKATGNYICIMDSDVEIFPGVMDRLIENLEHKTDIGLAVPKIVYPNGQLQKSTDLFPTITGKLYRYLFLKQIESNEASREASKESSGEISERASEVLREVDYAISAMWLLKQSMISHIGLLDEKIFYAPEDVDYCIRIWKSGYKIVYDNSISVIHHTQEISRGFRINKAFISHVKGLAYYFMKHRYLLKSPCFRTEEQ